MIWKTFSITERLVQHTTISIQLIYKTIKVTMTLGHNKNNFIQFYHTILKQKDFIILIAYQLIDI